MSGLVGRAGRLRQGRVRQERVGEEEEGKAQIKAILGGIGVGVGCTSAGRAILRALIKFGEGGYPSVHLRVGSGSGGCTFGIRKVIRVLEVFGRMLGGKSGTGSEWMGRVKGGVGSVLYDWMGVREMVWIVRRWLVPLPSLSSLGTILIDSTRYSFIFFPRL